MLLLMVAALLLTMADSAWRGGGSCGGASGSGASGGGDLAIEGEWRAWFTKRRPSIVGGAVGGKLGHVCRREGVTSAWCCCQNRVR